MGAPLIANYQSALFYPPTWIYFIAYSAGGIGALAWFLAIVVVLHLFWAGLGMALLIRALKLSKFAQIIGGLAFGLSGYLVARAGFLSINAAVAWLPWIILGATMLVTAIRDEPSEGNPDQRKRTRTNKVISAFLLLVMSLAMQLLAGHAQTAWYSLLLAVLWVVYLGIIDPWLEKRQVDREVSSVENSSKIRDVQETNRQNTGRSGLKSRELLLTLFGGALLLAAGVAAVQLLPTAEYLLESQRSAAVDYEFALSYSFWPWHFLSFLAPGLFGNPALGDYWGYANFWEDAVYIGLIPFVLALGGLITRGKKLPRGTLVNSRLIGFLGILILGTFLIALGRNTPIFPWLYRHVPTFDMFQAPTRISILAIFALAVLSAVGAESWARPGGRRLYWLRLGVMAAAAIAIGAGLALLLTRTLTFDIRPSLIRGTAWLGLWGVCLGVLALKAPKKASDSIQVQTWGWWQGAVICLVGLDLVVAGWGLNPDVDLSIYSQASPTADDVRDDLDGGRIFLSSEDEELMKFERFLRFDTFQPFGEGEDWQSLRASLLPNITVLDGLPSANNFDPLLPGRYSAWLELLQEVDADVHDQMLNLMGVTVVESIDLNETYGFRFDTREAYSRMRWVSCGIRVTGEDAAIELLLSKTVDHNYEAIIEAGSSRMPGFCNAQESAEIQVITEGPNLNLVRVKSQADGYLIISDVWYPGWQALIDGKQSNILRANYLFRAVAVPAGEHVVKIVYQPRSFIGGAVISSVALIVLLLLTVIWIRDKKSTRLSEAGES